MNSKEIYSDKIIKGRRTYFFDIKESEKGALYLKITESKKTEEGFEHRHVLIFEEDINDFTDAMLRVIVNFKDLKKSNTKDGNVSAIEKAREIYKQAYKPWTTEDDGKLESLYCEGKSVESLMEIFERNKGAIESRIKKLELAEKYKQ